MSKKLPFNSSNSSKSSDSTRKRFHRGFANVIKHLPIGDASEHVLTHFQKLHKVEEIPDKYRYPLRDDKKYKYVLRKEIPIDKLFVNNLYSNTNPGVFEVLYDNNYKINWSILAKHPDAFTKKLELENIIKSGVSSEFWVSLCENTNPNVIKFIEEKIDKEKKEYKSDYEKKRTFKERHYIRLAKNPTPEAIKLVKDRINEYSNEINIFIESLCMNPTPEAIELLKSNRLAMDILNQDYVKMYATSYFLWIKLLANPEAINFIKKECKWKDCEDEWNNLQKNPNPKAFKLLSEKRSGNIKYNYEYLSENPCSKAIKILKERMKQEKSMSINDNNNINWVSISENPRAKSLILAKIEEEKEITKDSRGSRYLYWHYVSANPAIFKRTRKMTDDKAKAKKIKEYLHPLPITPAN